MFGRKGKSDKKKSQPNDVDIKKPKIASEPTESIPEEKKSKFSMFKSKSGKKEISKPTEFVPKEKKSKFSMLHFKSGKKDKPKIIPPKSADEVIDDWNKYKDTESVEPEIKPVEPEIKPVEPEIKPVEPEIKPVEPEIKPVEKTTQLHESELKDIYADAEKIQFGELPDDEIIPPAPHTKFTSDELQRINIELNRVKFEDKKSSGIKHIESEPDSAISELLEKKSESKFPQNDEVKKIEFAPKESEIPKVESITNQEKTPEQITPEPSITNVLDNIQPKIESTKNELEKLKFEADSAKKEMDQISGELKYLKPDLESTRNELEKLKSQTESVKTEKDLISGELKYLKPDLESRKKELDKLKSETESVKTEKDLISGELKYLKPELESTKRDIAKLKSEKELLRFEVFAMTESMAQSQLRSSASTNFSTLGQLNQIEPDYEDELHRLKNQTEEAMNEREELEKKLEEAKKKGFTSMKNDEKNDKSISKKIIESVNITTGKSDFSKFSNDDLQMTYDELQKEVSGQDAPDNEQLKTIYQIYDEIISRSKQKHD